MIPRFIYPHCHQSIDPVTHRETRWAGISSIASAGFLAPKLLMETMTSWHEYFQSLSIIVLKLMASPYILGSLGWFLVTENNRHQRHRANLQQLVDSIHCIIDFIVRYGRRFERYYRPCAYFIAISEHVKTWRTDVAVHENDELPNGSHARCWDSYTQYGREIDAVPTAINISLKVPQIGRTIVRSGTATL